MIKLTETQINKKIEFINDYLDAENAATGSKLDANANVSIKNIATLEAEINKDINIQINRQLMKNKITELFGDGLASEYVRQIENHEIYVHDETSLKPYCVSVSMYPLLIDGLKKMGGESAAPKHLASFCGTFINFVFATSAQFAGAVATVEFLTYFDHYARKDFGHNYLKTNLKEVQSYFQQVVYSINQPAAARGYQSVFWNISIYDRYYFEAFFGNFVFPCGDKPNWQTLNGLQKEFLSWFNLERNKSLLTFPVVTAAVLTENKKIKDLEYKNVIANEFSNGNSFFVYLSDSVDSLASCCRLRNEVNSKEFSYSLGAGGVATGSINVITLNMNRLIQDRRDLSFEIQKIQNYQIAYRKLIEEMIQHKMLTVYDAGFIQLEKQYLTIGINGLVEAAEFMGIEISNNVEYIDFIKENLKVIFDLNKKRSQESGYKFNTEFVPAENLGVKNASWDKKDRYEVPRDCYNSYFYIVEKDYENPLEKFDMHGEEVLTYLDGGSALHLNLDEHLTKKQYELLLDKAARSGCNYFCINVKVTVCNDCEKISKRTLTSCQYCGSENIDYATRIIGYLKKITSFSQGRQIEHQKRNYKKINDKSKAIIINSDLPSAEYMQNLEF